MKGEGTLSLREDDEYLPQTEMRWSHLGVIMRNSVLDKSFAFRPKDRPKHRRA
jgi:hypothetical protein